MDKSQLDEATLAALLMRMKDFRLPRAQRLLKKVDEGNVLSEYDMAFLNSVYEDSRTIQPLVARNPKSHKLIIQLVDLYTEIIEKGLNNEKAD